MDRKQLLPRTCDVDFKELSKITLRKPETLRRIFNRGGASCELARQLAHILGCRMERFI